MTFNEIGEGDLVPWYINGGTAFLCAAVLLIMALLGPLGLGEIEYHTSQSALYQNQGQDIADLVLIVPLLLIGGALQLMRRPSAKYLLVLTPITLMYTGLSLGIGQEWTMYPGNAEAYYPIYLTLIIGGLVLLVGALSQFTPEDAPMLQRKGLKVFVALTALALLFLAKMWLGQVNEVVSTGDLSDGSYSDAPTVFWTIRYLDLGISIPVGFMALLMMLSRPRQAYPIMLLFFGFFITMAVTVNSMAAVQLYNDDPAVTSMGAGIAVFPVLGALSFVGLYYLLRPKLRPRNGGS